jgi:flavin-dependent dehydrogenase
MSPVRPIITTSATLSLLGRRMHSSTDILIVGGGPAGLAAAIALQQRGFQCTVVEARAPGIDKACGEGLMPDAVSSLAAMGVPLSAADGHPFRGIRFVNPHDRVAASFPNGVGIGVRRPHLHRLLRQRAEIAGASLLWESHVKLVDRNSALIDGAVIRFRCLVGADGNASTVRRWAGLDGSRTESLRYAIRRHYRLLPWTDHVEVHWGRSGQFYVTPVAPDCVGVVYITRNAKALRRDPLSDFPELAKRVAGAPIASAERRAATATRKLRRVAQDNVALIGDASGSVDAITGDGLAMTFRQALALADALASENLAAYEREHRRIARVPQVMGALLLAMDRWPQIQSRALDAMAKNPNLMNDLLSVHSGHCSPLRFAMTRGPLLGWNLARA